jgi:Kef-type K+ transport system membrane component KefB
VDGELIESRPVRSAAVAAYVAMLGGGVATFLLIRRVGEKLTAPLPVAPTGTAAPAPATSDAFFHLLIALAAVVIVGRLLGRMLRAIGQPPVIGEVIGGILLGPSLLGHLSPGLAASILPVSIAPFLNVVAQLGVVLYMFLVGLELNGDLVRERAHATVATSHASIILPFVMGSLLALYLYPRLSSSDVSFTSFALFMGVAMSITAFPVLARILTDLNLSKTQLGTVALTCAATDDVTAWCLLAVVVGVEKAAVEDAVAVVMLAAAFIALMFLLGRPLAARLLAKSGGRAPTADAVGALLAGLLLAALTTERIGVHAVFGAFLFGAVIPHDSELAQTVIRKLEDLVTILLLPAFFAFTGMRTEVGLLSGVDQWVMCGLIVLVATAGKFGGTLVAARLTGLSWHGAASLGILMNTRGLMQLVVLNIGLDLKVISPTLFTMMVLMAIVTTVATTPVLQLLGTEPLLERRAAAS